MTYEKPQVRDFGDIAKHTYNVADDDDGFPGVSCEITLG
jgi:hypothetical protein